LPNLACACAKEKVFLPMTDSVELEKVPSPAPAPALAAAPLLTRILAMVLDSLALLVLLGSGVYLAFLSSKFIIFPRSSLSGVGAALLVALPAIALIVLLAVPIYFAIFESSAWSATPGKWATGLVVRRSDGQRLGFFAALFARFIYWMPCLILPLGAFYMPIYAMAQLALAGVLAGLFCDKKRRTAADLACKRFVCSANEAPLAPATNFWQKLPMPLIAVLTMSGYLFLAPIIMFSFGQMGNLVYRQKLTAWRAKGLHTKGRVVFVERRIMAPSVLSDNDLAEFEADPESLPPAAIVSVPAVVGKKIVGIVNQGAVLTAEAFEPADVSQIEQAEAERSPSGHSDAQPGVLVYRWRDRVRPGQLISLKDIEPVYIVEEQFIDSICCTPWQIVGRTVSENCQALKRDIIHCQYVDAPVSTLVVKRDLKKGEVLRAEDVEVANLSAKQHYYTAISAPQLVLGAKLKRDVATGQALRYCDFEKLIY
jgi:flagella basal body P-ring formation protein FlgA